MLPSGKQTWKWKNTVQYIFFVGLIENIDKIGNCRTTVVTKPVIFISSLCLKPSKIPLAFVPVTAAETAGCQPPRSTWSSLSCFLLQRKMIVKNHWGDIAKKSWTTMHSFFFNNDMFFSKIIKINQSKIQILKKTKTPIWFSYQLWYTPCRHGAARSAYPPEIASTPRSLGRWRRNACWTLRSRRGPGQSHFWAFLFGQFHVFFLFLFNSLVETRLWV